FQAEDGIRDFHVTGVQTCALPISHIDLLDFFDRCRASFDEKQLYVEKIKRRWSTQKSRKNNPDKKQYNFVLNEEINASLNRLARSEERRVGKECRARWTP